jgi:hypothetical protein
MKAFLRSVLPEPAVEFAKGILASADSALFETWKRRQSTHPLLRKPIFMIGCPRSGTDIIGNTFGTHPSLALWSEAGTVWDPDHFFDPEADHYWDANAVTEEAARRMHENFEYYRWKKRKGRFINKHPRNSVRIEYIQEIFPDATFIHIIRDGRAVTHSIVARTQREPNRQETPFGMFCKPPNWRNFLREDPIEQAALQWREIVGYVMNKKDELGATYTQIKYEDFCNNPRESLSAVYEFVGLPVSNSIVSGIPESMTNMNTKYKSDLSEDKIEVINEIQRDLLIELGYEV